MAKIENKMAVICILFLYKKQHNLIVFKSNPSSPPLIIIKEQLLSCKI